VKNAIKVQMASLVPNLLKITKAERIEEVVLIHVWLSGIKTRYKLIFFRQCLLLRDKITIFTVSKHVL
jgi:hypothetical protein